MRGEKSLADLYRANPTDNDLAQALKNISAQKTLDEGGYEALSSGTGSYRDILKDKEQAVSLEQENRVEKGEDVTGRLIREYEARLKTEPDNLKLIRSLAELYVAKEGVRPGARPITSAQGLRCRKRRLAGPRDRRNSGRASMTRRFHNWTPTSRITRSGSRAPGRKAGVYSSTNAKKRVDRFPTDLQIRFELGQLYFRPARSARPSANSRNPRTTRIGASPR